METRKRIKNKIITSNKNAVLAISVFDSRKSFGPDTSDDDPKEDVKLDNDGEDPDDIFYYLLKYQYNIMNRIFLIN
jgi:hypothetical protein